MSALHEASGKADAPYSARQIRIILVFALLGTLLDGSELNLVGYPLSYIAQTFHVSTLQVVSVATYQGFASVLGGFIFGWLGDTLGRRRIFALSVLLFGLAAAGGGLAPTFILFVASRMLAGIGMGGLFGLSFAMFTECWHTRARGTMGGVIQSMYFLGEILTALLLLGLMTWLGHGTGWRAGYVVIGGASILTSVATYFVLPESKAWLDYQQHLKAGTLPPQLERRKVPFIDIFRADAWRGTISFMVMATAMFLTTNSVGAYLSTYLIKNQHLSLGRATCIVLLGYVATIVSYSGTGVLSDRMRRKHAFSIACVVGLVGFGWFLALVLTHSDRVGTDFWAHQTFWALMVCAAGAGGFGVLGVWMSEFYPTRIRSTGSNSSYYVGRGLGAGVYPLFALTLAGSVPMALALGLVGPLLGLCSAACAPDRTGRAISGLE